MKCLDCGRRMKTANENIRYGAGGLPHVVLGNVTVGRCPACGYEEVPLPHIEELHRTLAGILIRKPARLAGPEIRFLRKYLGWSSNDFADRMGTARETVSRWESGRQPIGAQADRLLRLLVAHEAPIDDYSVETLANIDDAGSTPELRVSVRRSGHWTVPAVA